MSESATEKQPMGGTTVLERTEAELRKDPRDNGRHAHYVRKDRITASAVTGQAVVALRGKVWVPMHDPKSFPICPACKEIMNSMHDRDSDNPSWPFAGNQYIWDNFGNNSPPA